jgi:hypothetical protein
MKIVNIGQQKFVRAQDRRGNREKRAFHKEGREVASI